MLKKRNLAYFRKVLQAVWKDSNSFSFIHNIHRIYQDFDDPQVFQYSSAVNASEIDTDGFKEITMCTGSSMDSEEEALAKCLIEALERKANLTYKKKDLIRSSFNKLVKSNRSAIEPLLFSPFSKEQLCQKKYTRFDLNKDSIILWKEAICLNTNQKVLIPAELAYFNFLTDIKVMIPISTGTAAGATRDDAILRGIYEVIERDAFMIRYLSKTTGKEILFKKLKKFRKIERICEKYRLMVRFIDITVDMSVPTVLAILTNRPSVGPSVSIGIKTYPDYIEAINGAFMEALQTRTWIRHHCEDLESKRTVNIPIRTFEERGVYWYNKKMLPHLSFFTNSIKGINIKQKKLGLMTLDKILVTLNSVGHRIYVIDLTPVEYKNIPISIVKVIIPTLHPLYLSEEFPYYGNERLTKITKNFNTIPHPFL